MDAELPPWHEQLGHDGVRKRVTEQREAQGLTVEELAEKAGLQIGLVANVENGREFPVRESTLAALESVLGELERPGPTGPLCDKEPLHWRRSNGEWNRALYIERADKGDEVTVPVLGTTHDATRDGRIIDSSGGLALLDIRLEPKPSCEGTLEIFLRIFENPGTGQVTAKDLSQIGHKQQWMK